MTKEIAIKVAVVYELEKKVAETARKGMFWSNPVFSQAYYGNWKTIMDGEEYTLSLTGIDGYPPEGYAIKDTKGGYVELKNEEVA